VSRGLVLVFRGCVFVSGGSVLVSGGSVLVSGGCVFVSGGAYSYPEWRIRVLEAHISIRGVRISVRVGMLCPEDAY